MARMLIQVVFLSVALMLAGCAGSATVRNLGSFDATRERDAIYVIPFDTTLVPQQFGEPIFNDFVDLLNARRKETKVSRFVILKEELKDVEPAWLVKQTYISGDIWGYVESSGCCSTEIKAKSRIYLYEPGSSTPALEVFVPVEDFFEHDRSDPATVKARLGKKLSNALVDAIIRKLKP